MQVTNPIWTEVQQSLQKTLSKPSFETWIRPAKFNCFENGILTLIAPNTFSSDWLRKNYCETIEKAAKEICGHDVKVVFKSETNISSDITNKENLNEQGMLMPSSDVHQNATNLMKYCATTFMALKAGL